ncbi:serine/threonine-protein phosphatase 2A regulatory subunit B [Nematocida sp. LUAm3]|nr:serine/threonine-protein phosphatase 2A regulatory subunit B [Nematocida sp. LUAm3]KAI5175297.1 serine/threonine-protein phosphatase 2A regulatory subunit B [Nematocida sp. LUAm2]KAI5177746.1 serine/threonine-protein phosphatase 2A regulatory subunit B [Nematocida sp. LUAm1]
MLWSTWKCKQTIKAAPADCYRSSIIKDDSLVLGRNKGIIEVYKIRRNLRKRIEFRSHASTFDYLRSTEISESIESIDIMPSGNKEILILSSNAKNIKMWNVHSSYVKNLSTTSTVECCSDTSSISCEEKEVCSKNFQENQRMKDLFRIEGNKRHVVELEREEAPKNIYSIHSLSISKNTENILVSDELTVTIYNRELQKPNVTINLKPSRFDELTKVISSTKFVEGSSNSFVYGTSSGTMHVHDLRECTQSTLSFSLHSARTGDFYSEIIRPISDIHFISDNQFVSRNLLSVSLHDARSPYSPVKEYEVYPLARAKISDLYDSDEIFSKFKMGVLNNKVYTGSFNSAVAEIDIKTGEIVRSFLESEMNGATRIVDGKKVTCVSVDSNCLIGTVANQCYIFRQSNSSIEQ